MSLPPGWKNDKSGWCQISDTVHTVSNKLTISTKTKFTFVNPGIVAKGPLVISNNSIVGKLFPAQVEDFYLLQLTLRSEVPPGTNNFLSLFVESNSQIIHEELQPYLMPPEVDQPINFVFMIPATTDIMEHGIELFLEPSIEVDLWDVVLTANKTFNIGLN